MYLAIVVLLMAVLPIASIAIELASGGGGLVFLVAKWFAFWAVGLRLALAGVRQILDPNFTARTIFGVKDEGALIIVQELGFANLAIGGLGMLSLLRPSWVVPAAMVGATFYGLAGIKHLRGGDRNATENIAMVSDLFVCAVIVGDLAARWLRLG